MIFASPFESAVKVVMSVAHNSLPGWVQSVPPVAMWPVEGEGSISAPGRRVLLGGDQEGEYQEKQGQ